MLPWVLVGGNSGITIYRINRVPRLRVLRTRVAGANLLVTSDVLWAVPAKHKRERLMGVGNKPFSYDLIRIRSI